MTNADNLTSLLQSIPGDSLFADAIRTEAGTNLPGVVQMIKDQIKDGHRVLVVDIVGENVVQLIEEI